MFNYQLSKFQSCSELPWYIRWKPDRGQTTPRVLDEGPFKSEEECEERIKLLEQKQPERTGLLEAVEM